MRSQDQTLAVAGDPSTSLGRFRPRQTRRTDCHDAPGSGPANVKERLPLEEIRGSASRPFVPRGEIPAIEVDRIESF